jgi:serine/threonine-protein kinase
VNVFDYGEQRGDSDECVSFLVMELVSGRSLADTLRDRGRLPVGDVVELVRQAALGLAAAHDRGLVHRDVKPGNLLLTDSGQVKLTDFGITRAADAVPITRTGVLVGTAQYMSPEQAAGRSATANSDLYSLGCVAYQALTGRAPFAADSEVATALAHLNQPVPSLPADVPPAAAELITGLLAKDPALRPQPAAEVAVRAAAAATEASTSALSEAPTTFVVADTTQQTVMSVPGLSRRPRVGRRAIAAGAAALVAAVVVAVVVTAASSGPGTASVPRVAGERLAAAQARLTHAGFRVSVKHADAPNTQRGVVIRQHPASGTDASRGTTVTLTAATGNVLVRPAEYVGFSYASVAAALKALGLRAASIDVSSSRPAGTVLALRSSGEVPVGSTVVVSVASPIVVHIAPAHAHGKPEPKPKPAGKAHAPKH